MAMTTASAGFLRAARLAQPHCDFFNYASFYSPGALMRHVEVSLTDPSCALAVSLQLRRAFRQSTHGAP
jgi:hypothetical protein